MDLKDFNLLLGAEMNNGGAKAMRAALVATAFCLGLASVAAKAGEAKFSLDRPFTLVNAEDIAVSSADFPEKMAADLFRIHALFRSVSDRAQRADRSARRDRTGSRRCETPVHYGRSRTRPRPDAARFYRRLDKRLIGLTGTQEQITEIAHALGVKYEKVLLDNEDYVVDHSSTLSLVDPSGHWAVTFKLAEPYMIAAKLLELLDQSGTALGAINNLGAYR